MVRAAADRLPLVKVEAVRAEFLRVLKPHSKVALIGNDCALADPLHSGLNGIFA